MKNKVLIIEDEKSICDFLAANIERHGFKVIKAYDGLEGLEKALQEKPDLIILDLKLPKLPGEEVCRQIRKNEETANIPIIMETAKASDVDRIVGRVIGADCYIKKPYTSQELLRHINELLSDCKT